MSLLLISFVYRNFIFQFCICAYLFRKFTLLYLPFWTDDKSTWPVPNSFPVIRALDHKGLRSSRNSIHFAFGECTPIIIRIHDNHEMFMASLLYLVPIRSIPSRSCPISFLRLINRAGTSLMICFVFDVGSYSAAEFNVRFYIYIYVNVSEICTYILLVYDLFKAHPSWITLFDRPLFALWQVRLLKRYGIQNFIQYNMYLD